MKCSEAELSEILNPYVPWLHAKASRMLGQPHDREDLAQEGLIAMWQAVVKFDESRGVPLDFYLKKSATWRMLTVVQKDVHTGRPRRIKKDDLPVVIPVSPLPTPGGDSDMVLSMLDWLIAARSWSGSDSVFDAALFSLHRRDIVNALLTALTPQQRKFVVLKFMYGLSYSELAEFFGYIPTTLFRPHHLERLTQALLPLKGLIDGSE